MITTIRSKTWRKLGGALVALAVLFVCGVAASQAVVTQIPGVLYTSGSLRRQIIPVSGTTYQVVPGNSDFISITSPPCTVTLPKSDAVVQGDTYEVADGAGTAGTNNITIQGNGTTINGLSSYTINTNYGYVELIRDSSEWKAQAGTSSFTPAGAASGDLGGTYPNPTVVAITGTAGVANVRSTAALSFGTTPSSTGTIRLQNGSIANNCGNDCYKAIAARNFANNGDYAIVSPYNRGALGAGKDGASFGLAADGTGEVDVDDTGVFLYPPTGAPVLQVLPAGININAATTSFSALVGTGTRTVVAGSTGTVASGPVTVLTGTVQTTNATVTTIITSTPAASTMNQIDAHCVSAQTNGTAYSDHTISSGWRRNGSGNATQVGTTTTIASHASSTQAINVAQQVTSVVLQVTGLAGTTINWTCDAEIRTQAGQ